MGYEKATRILKSWNVGDEKQGKSGPRGSGGAEKDKGLKNVTIDRSETFWSCRLHLKGLHLRCASISYINFLNFASDRC